jgi:transposase InsO family protein
MSCNIVEHKSGRVVAQARPENDLWKLDFQVRGQPQKVVKVLPQADYGESLLTEDQKVKRKISNEKCARITQELLDMGATNESGDCLQIEKDLFDIEPEEIPEFMLMNTDSPQREDSAPVDATEYDLKLWHHRLCHLGETNLRKLQQKKMVHGLPSMKFEGRITGSCEACLKGKAQRSPFPTPPVQPRKYEVLELVHSDVCEMPVNTYGGARYFLTLLDEKSKRSWIYLMKAKSEVTDHFKSFVRMVERQVGKKIRILRSDNGGEYVNKQLKDFLRDCGIQQQTTIPKTPEQNGAAERLNRTILDKVRCMLIGSGLSQRLWGEAIFTANYVRNRSPTSEHPDKTPEEAYIGHKPSISHLRVFGSKVSVWIPESNRKKLDPRSWDGVLVGYGMGNKGYRVWDPKRQATYNARNVVINESNIMNKHLGGSSTVIEDYEPEEDLPIAESKEKVSFTVPGMSTEPSAGGVLPNQVPGPGVNRRRAAGVAPGPPRASTRQRSAPQRLTADRLGGLHCSWITTEEQEIEAWKQGLTHDEDDGFDFDHCYMASVVEQEVLEPVSVREAFGGS